MAWGILQGPPLPRGGQTNAPILRSGVNSEIWGRAGEKVCHRAESKLHGTSQDPGQHRPSVPSQFGGFKVRLTNGYKSDIDQSLPQGKTEPRDCPQATRRWQ